MNTKKGQETTMDFAQRFVKAAEELRLTGAQLYRDGIVTNEQVLSKVKKGCQRPTKKSIDLLCLKYGVSPVWIYDGVGAFFTDMNKNLGFKINTGETKPFYKMGFDSCLDNNGQLISSGHEIPVIFPNMQDIDFWCINYDNSLLSVISPGDIIALRKLNAWKDYIPGGFICIFVTKQFKILRKVSVRQDDEQCISVIQMDDGKAEESKIPKDFILSVYQVVGNYSSL